MTVSIRTCIFALIAFCVAPLAAFTQVKPAFIGTPTAGDPSVKGVGDPTGKIYVCVSTIIPSPPSDCTTGPPATLTVGNSGGTPATPTPDQLFSVSLSKSAASGSYLYLVQKIGATAPAYSAIIAIPPVAIKAVITSSLAAGAREVDGIGDPTGKIYVCVAPPPTVPSASDCSGSAAPLTVSGSPTSSVQPDANQTFKAKLASPIAAGSYVYLTQVVSGVGTTLSDIVAVAQPVTSPAPTVKPSISGTLAAGITTLSGIADPAATNYICISATAPTTPIPDCAPTGILIPSSAFSAGSHRFTADIDGEFVAGNSVYLEQVPTITGSNLYSNINTVISNPLEQTDFVGGSLFSANGSNYSQGNIFLALNYDRTVSKSTSGHPLNLFFQARLTTIPVNASQSTQMVTQPASGSPTATPPTTSVASFLAAQKAAQFGGGGYIPIVFNKTDSTETTGQAFYWGPIARFGFSTPSGSPGGSSTASTTNGSTTTTTTTTTTTLGTSNANNGLLYNYWLAGLRIATADVTLKTLHTRHYFDVGVGKYSNLQSLTCPTSGCSGSTLSTENRATLLRLVFEGYLEIATTNNTSLILGLSANTGPGAINHRTGIDINNRAPEDIEFLIGYKFDFSQLVGVLPVIGH